MAQGDITTFQLESDAAKQPPALSLVENILNQLIGIGAGPKGQGTGQISAGAVLGLSAAITNLIIAATDKDKSLTRKIQDFFNRDEIKYLLSLRNRGQITGPLNLAPGLPGARGIAEYTATEMAPPFPQPASGGGVYAPGTYLGQTGQLQGALVKSKRVKISHLVTSGTESILNGIANRLFAGAA